MIVNAGSYVCTGVDKAIHSSPLQITHFSEFYPHQVRDGIVLN